MSLMDTFVQVFEFDTRQADGAFDRVRRSTDDIIDGMKKAGQSGQRHPEVSVTLCRRCQTR